MALRTYYIVKKQVFEKIYENLVGRQGVTVKDREKLLNPVSPQVTV